jgi:cyclohexanone monooxygenase
MTGSLIRLNVRGRDGLDLALAWTDGPTTYLGLAVHGFPNFFTITGPGSPAVLSNVVLAIEQHVEWLGDLLANARSAGTEVIEADADAQDAWTRHSAEAAEKTLMMGVDSWYLGANIPGKPRVMLPYIGGVDVYRATCDQVAAEGYRGLSLTSRAASPSENRSAYA